MNPLSDPTKNVFIYGRVATGKTTLVMKLFRSAKHCVLFTPISHEAEGPFVHHSLDNLDRVLDKIHSLRECKPLEEPIRVMLDDYSEFIVDPEPECNRNPETGQNNMWEESPQAKRLFQLPGFVLSSHFPTIQAHVDKLDLVVIFGKYLLEREVRGAYDLYAKDIVTFDEFKVQVFLLDRFEALVLDLKNKKLSRLA